MCKSTLWQNDGTEYSLSFIRDSLLHWLAAVEPRSSVVTPGSAAFAHGVHDIEFGTGEYVPATQSHHVHSCSLWKVEGVQDRHVVLRVILCCVRDPHHQEKLSSTSEKADAVINVKTPSDSEPRTTHRSRRWGTACWRPGRRAPWSESGDSPCRSRTRPGTAPPLQRQGNAVNGSINHFVRSRSRVWSRLWGSTSLL